MSKAKQKKLFLVVASLIFLFFSTASAMGMNRENEEDDLDRIEKFIKKKRVNAAYLMIGQNMLQINQLNNFLALKDLPTLPKNYLTYGFGGHVIHNKFVLSFEYQRSFNKKQISMKEFNTFLSMKYSTLNIGYLLYSKKGMMMYPLLGVGLSELRLKVMKNDINSFHDIDKNHNVSDNRIHSILVNTGIALDYFVNFDKKKQGKNNLVIGIRAGYLISAIKSNWAIDSISVADGPHSGLTGPYIHLTIGLGGWVEKLIANAI